VPKSQETVTAAPNGNQMHLFYCWTFLERSCCFT